MSNRISTFCLFCPSSSTATYRQSSTCVTSVVQSEMGTRQTTPTPSTPLWQLAVPQGGGHAPLLSDSASGSAANYRGARSSTSRVSPEIVLCSYLIAQAAQSFTLVDRQSLKLVNLDRECRLKETSCRLRSNSHDAEICRRIVWNYSFPIVERPFYPAL